MSKEENVQKALGTTRNFWVNFDIAFRMRLGAFEVVEALDEKDAVTRLKKYLETDEGKQQVIARLVDVMWDDRREYGEDLANDLQELEIPAIEFLTETAEVSGDEEDIEPTIPIK